jgi:hypothetical protein
LFIFQTVLLIRHYSYYINANIKALNSLLHQAVKTILIQYLTGT